MRRSKLRCKFFISPKSANLSVTSSSEASSCTFVTRTIHPSTADCCDSGQRHQSAHSKSTRTNESWLSTCSKFEQRQCDMHSHRAALVSVLLTAAVSTLSYVGSTAAAPSSPPSNIGVKQTDVSVDAYDIRWKETYRSCFGSLCPCA